HGLDRITAVRRAGVAVEVASQVVKIDQARETPGFRRRDLTTVFAKLWRHERQAERLVNPFFGLAGDPLVALHAVEAVLVQLQTTRNGAFARRNVVLFRAGKVLLRGAEALARNEAEIRLKAAGDSHARFRLAVGEYPLDERV